jgi:Zn-dependent M32 family carboxypeptidase
MELGEVGIRFLKENLTNDFFKEAEVKDEPDHIIFSNEEFDILFSKTLDKTIEIRAKKIKWPFALYKPLSERIIKLGDAIEAFLKERTLQNFKRMADCNDMGYGKSPVGQLFKYVDTYKKCNKELLKKIREKQKEDEERKKKAEEERKVYEKEVEQAKKFIESLTDLNIFREAGWTIKERI